MNTEDLFYEKYMKYKNKYILLRESINGYSQSMNKNKYFALRQGINGYSQSMNKNKYLALHSENVNNVDINGGYLSTPQEKVKARVNGILVKLQTIIKKKSELLKKKIIAVKDDTPVLKKDGTPLMKDGKPVVKNNTPVMKDGKKVFIEVFVPSYFTTMRFIILELKEALLEYKSEHIVKDTKATDRDRDKENKEMIRLFASNHKKIEKIITDLKLILCENMKECLINKESYLLEKDDMTPSVNGKIIVKDFTSDTAHLTKTSHIYDGKEETHYTISENQDSTEANKKNEYRFSQIKDLLKELSDVEQLFFTGSIKAQQNNFDCTIETPCVVKSTVVFPASVRIADSPNVKESGPEHTYENVRSTGLSEPTKPTGPIKPTRPLPAPPRPRPPRPSNSLGPTQEEQEEGTYLEIISPKEEGVYMEVMSSEEAGALARARAKAIHDAEVEARAQAKAKAKIQTGRGPEEKLQIEERIVEILDNIHMYFNNIKPDGSKITQIISGTKGTKITHNGIDIISYKDTCYFLTLLYVQFAIMFEQVSKYLKDNNITTLETLKKNLDIAIQRVLEKRRAPLVQKLNALKATPLPTTQDAEQQKVEVAKRKTELEGIEANIAKYTIASIDYLLNNFTKINDFFCNMLKNGYTLDSPLREIDDIDCTSSNYKNLKMKNFRSMLDELCNKLMLGALKC